MKNNRKIIKSLLLIAGILIILAIAFILLIKAYIDKVPVEEEGKGENTLELQMQEESSDTFDFSELENISFVFCSGAGGWMTEMTINSDGSFQGEYHDSDMGSSGEGYDGTIYQSKFSGQFTEPEKINEYTYSVMIQKINYENEPNTEEIKDNALYKYTEAYGLEDTEEILIYLPGVPSTELPEEFVQWIGYDKINEDGELSVYGLYNVVPKNGFSGYEVEE